VIKAHGGSLVNCIAEDEERRELLEKARSLKDSRRLELGPREVSDLEMIAIGGYSPLEGFMTREDYESTLRYMRLASGLPWTVPVTLAAFREEARGFREGDDILLTHGEKGVLAILHLEEKFEYDKRLEGELVYGTTDEAHPGVEALYRRGQVLLGGKITLINRPEHRDFLPYRLDPAQTRRIFRDRGWRRIVGFQTRNPVHRAHEYILKSALEIVDGLLLHPIVGETKKDDIPADVRMRCYQVLLEESFPEERVVLAVNPSSMRYAGPREAVFHAIIRKNYGCTHFIVGRDHAGVGNYYPPLAAQEIFQEFSREELGITPLFFDNSFYCKRCGGMASVKTCPHSNGDRLSLSGTRVREFLKKGEIPGEFTRPAVAEVLVQWWRRSAC